MSGPGRPADGPSGPVWTLTVDATRCLGTGVCVGTAPHLLALRDGRAQPHTNAVPADDALHDLADACPADAVVVVEAPPPAGAAL